MDSQTLPHNFDDLRMRMARTPGFESGWTHYPQRERLLSIVDTNRKAFLIESAEWLKRCPADAKIHLMRASILADAGDQDGQAYHFGMYAGLMGSIFASGDGKTEATAFKVIAVEEEYTFLSYLDASLQRQALKGDCDVLEVLLAGQTMNLFFDVSLPKQALRLALGESV